MRLLFVLGLLLMSFGASAMDIPPGGIQLDAVHGAFRPLCGICSIIGGDTLQCSGCRYAYGVKWYNQAVNLRPCANGTILVDPRSGHLYCTPEIGGNFRAACKNTVMFETYKLSAVCRKPGSHNWWTEYSWDRPFDVNRCHRPVVNWDSRTRSLVCASN